MERGGWGRLAVKPLANLSVMKHHARGINRKARGKACS
jgi:hypothetical protein